MSPSINVLTYHPRYYSFYAFLLDEFWRRDLPRSRASWVAFYRRVSVGAYKLQHRADRPEHGDMGKIVGRQKTDPLAAQQRQCYDAVAGARSYIKSTLGGYGLYYRTVMARLQIIYPGGPGFPCPIACASGHPDDDCWTEPAAASDEGG